MRSYLIFRIKRYLEKKSTIFKFGIVFLAVGLVMFGDIALGWIENLNALHVYHSFPQPIEEKGVIFEKNKEDADLILYQIGDDYHVDSKISLSDSQIKLLQKALFEKDNQAYYPNLVVHQKESSKDFNTAIFLTVLFFTILNQGVNISQEIIDEKISKVSDFVLMGISPRKHMVCMMGYAWFKQFFDWIVFGTGILFWGLIRFGYDQGSGWMKYWDVSINNRGTHIQWVSLFLLIIGMMMVEVIQMICASYVKNVEEVGNVMLLPNIGMMGIYYGVMWCLLEGHGVLLGFLSCIPIVQWVALPFYISIEGKGIVIGLGIVISCLMSYGLIRYGSSYYERGILRQNG